MEMRFLGKETEHLNSPTLYATDQATYLIQGWKVTDPEILAKLDVPVGETVVEIYARLMAHLAEDGLSGVVTSWTPPIVHVKENGNLVIQGKRLLAVMSRQRISLGIIPSMGKRHTWASVGFWIFDRHTVHIDTPSAELTITQRSEISVFEKKFDRHQRSAVYGQQARNLIERVLADLSSGSPT